MIYTPLYFFFFFFNDTATTEIYTLSLHDALPICRNSGHGMRLRFDRETARHEQGFWYYEMELFNDPILGRPVLEEYALDRFLAQGYRVVVLSSGVYDRYRRSAGRDPIQKNFFVRVAPNR